MASQSLLAVPAKSTKSVDFTQPFTRFIANNYDDQPGKYHDAISEFNGLRESTVVRTPDKHETGLDLITRFVCICVCCAVVHECGAMSTSRTLGSGGVTQISVCVCVCVGGL